MCRGGSKSSDWQVNGAEASFSIPVFSPDNISFPVPYCFSAITVVLLSSDDIPVPVTNRRVIPVSIFGFYDISVPVPDNDTPIRG